MEIIIIVIIAIIVVAVMGYYIMKLTTERDVQKNNAESYLRELNTQKTVYEQQIDALKTSYEQQLQLTKEAHERQIATLKQMNEEQVKSQLDLIREQMQTTSEKVLKMRQEELGVQNKEQVSKIIDPLQKSLKDMQEALDKTKEQQTEALTRLDETIKINMQKSQEIGETADRLTRALTGEVKVQGNFGELKLKQLLEDLELKEGEQFDTQETLKDKGGKGLKGDDGKGLIPDFILHFPNNRHVVVDSKMSLTDYERYMNAEDGTPEKSAYLKAHIDSVRAQVKRLAKKEYTKYLPDGYNRLNFAIMYIPIEGAMNLALLNDTTLWREAYDEGVMILGRHDTGTTDDVYESARAGDDVDTGAPAEEPAGDDGCRQYCHRPCAGLRTALHGRRGKHERHPQEDGQAKDYHRRQRCKHYHCRQEPAEGWCSREQEKEDVGRDGRLDVH